MLCAMSGQSPAEPVVSRTGHIFEKKLVTKYLKQNGKCPITNEPLSEEELIPVQSNSIVKPRPAAATSVPGMLNLFQGEWDALMLESFGIKKELDQVKQELSHSLYQHDAALRVIARLIKERDEARSSLSNIKGTIPEASSAETEKMEVEAEKAGDLPEQVIENINSASKRLSRARKRRVVPPTLPLDEEIKAYQELSSQSLHAASAPGLTCVDIHPEKFDLILTGGVDKTGILYNKAEDSIEAKLKHTKKITDVLFHPTEDILFTTSQDKTAKIWSKSGKTYKPTAIKSHNGEVSAVDLSPTGSYIITSSLDYTWGFHDIQTATTIAKFSTETALQTVQFHPDGLILAVGGDDSNIRIFDIKNQTQAALFDGHKDKVVDLSFSENGYYLATASSDGTVKLWDLRKPKNFQTIEFEAGSSVTSCNFDDSGNYLIIGGSDVRIYQGKNFQLVKAFHGHEQLVTDVQFAKDASFFVSTSMDRHVKIWGK